MIIAELPSPFEVVAAYVRCTGRPWCTNTYEEAVTVQRMGACHYCERVFVHADGREEVRRPPVV